MTDAHLYRIAEELNLNPAGVTAVINLLEEGGTIPFIARYRKEATGSLDEVAVTGIRDRLAQLQELDKRRESILKSLEDRELLSDELKDKILAADTLTVLEDIYLPYRPKRRTRAVVAREKGLEPLALALFEQAEDMDPRAEAGAFVDQEMGVETVEDALAGARDIVAEWVSQDQEARAGMRALYEKRGVIKSRVITGQEETGAKFRDYFDWEEPVSAVPSHRLLAMRRGENEGVLLLGISPPEEEALDLLEGMFIKGAGPASEEVRAAVRDGYKRLLSLSMETEIRLLTKERADVVAIRVFADNLRELLLAPPLGQKNILAVDPGFRTGCKLVSLDRQGELKHTGVIFPFGSEKQKEASAALIRELCERFQVEAVAVGNGTGGRETEAFINGLNLPGSVPVIMVNESGASIYSASDAARAEFPDLDLTLRGAASIGRRLMDPLAELVKIDPKSIGVGQYQHDVNQQEIKRNLDDVVVSCVNAVGVEVNTASEQLLTYVSGLGPQLAKKIVGFRAENGPFTSREGLKKVPRLGPKAFEQAAGFLRIRGGDNHLDASAVHPESYRVVETMAGDLGCKVRDLMEDAGLRERIRLDRYVTDTVGLPTLMDIMDELAAPGRDPRDQFTAWPFTEGVDTLEDLEVGMKLPGVVTNVTNFGAFVDIGVHQDGLVHISQLADHFVRDIQAEVKVHQRVTVTVLDVDADRKRISLSMKENTEQPRQGPKEKTGTPERKRKPRPDGPRKPAPFNAAFADAFKKNKKR